MFELAVLNTKGEKVESVALDEKIFAGKVNKPLLHQVVVGYLANQRQGNASTKTQGETRGGGKKPWRQKGTGRARAGSIRSPLWRGGGTTFGPHPRDYRYSVPKKILRRSVIEAFNSKLNDSAVIVIERLSLAAPKTREFAGIMKNLKVSPPALFISDKLEKNALLAGRNIEGISFKAASDVNAYELLHCDKVVITKDAFSKLTRGGKR